LLENDKRYGFRASASLLFLCVPFHNRLSSLSSALCTFSKPLSVNFKLYFPITSPQEPGGEIEHRAAQLLFDTTLPRILGSGLPDSEQLREVLGQGSEELTRIVLWPLQSARTETLHALSQVATLQEALDEADREIMLMRVREQASGIRFHVHDASTCAIRTTLTSNNPPISTGAYWDGKWSAIHRPRVPVKRDGCGTAYSSIQCDIDKELRLQACETLVAREIATCEQQVLSLLALLVQNCTVCRRVRHLSRAKLQCVSSRCQFTVFASTKVQFCTDKASKLSTCKIATCAGDAQRAAPARTHTRVLECGRRGSSAQEPARALQDAR
jgi:hypothetical protein